MKRLFSLDGNGSNVAFILGNDGYINISFNVPEKKVFLECVRVGTGNSGGQEVPIYVKTALIEVCKAMDKWEKEDSLNKK